MFFIGWIHFLKPSTLLIDDANNLSSVSKSSEKEKVPKEAKKVLFQQEDDRIYPKQDSQIRTWRDSYLNKH